MCSRFPQNQGRSVDRENLSDQLFQGIQSLHLQVNQTQFDQLLDYLEMLHRWNGVYNLTAIRNPDAMVQQHLLDSLAVVPAFESSRHVLDVGSGGGLPGMVLAIARPHLRIELIDAVNKKTAFLNQVKLELGLKNVDVHSGRVENLSPKELFDTITSRAFASLGDMIQVSQHLLEPSGRYIAMKGSLPGDEIKDLPLGWRVEEVRAIKVPGLNAERHLVFMRRTGT